MKVCHFISSQGLGRGEFYIDLINEQCLNEGIECYLLVPKNSKFKDRVSSRVEIIEYKSKDSRYNIFLYFELMKIFNSFKFDLVHTHFAKSTEVFYRLNKLLNINHVATKHNSRKGKIFNKLKYVTAVSKGVAKTISIESKVIYNGIKYNALRNSNINDKFTICAVGRLDKIKGFDILINELSTLKEDFILNIVGDGEERESLESIIKEKSLENKVKLLGFRTDIPQILNKSDLVIMSSHSEGFSVLMIESIFYAKVFISTNVNGCNEVLSDRLLIDGFSIANKVKDVINNYNDYVSEFKKIKDIQKDTLKLENIAKEYIKYYEWVIENENSSN
ncbi:glycosyltransferase [Arcobacter sp. YIC-464]|uniref:glycosyltransferase n=1 Tax=Arcobacter sp. YIC-464 TaxID=3376631 RepID=UPI003C232B3D